MDIDLPMQEQPKKSKKELILIVFFTAIIAGTIGFSVGKQTEEEVSQDQASSTKIPSITAQSSASPTTPAADIQITKDNIDRFLTYKMPEGWKIETDPEGEKSFTIVSPDYSWNPILDDNGVRQYSPYPSSGTNIDIDIDIYSINAFVDNYINEITNDENINAYGKNKKEVLVKGYPGYTYYDASGGRYGYTLIKINNDNIIQWHFTLGVANKEYEPTLDAFVQSIDFKE